MLEDKIKIILKKYSNVEESYIITKKKLNRTQ